MWMQRHGYQMPEALGDKGKTRALRAGLWFSHRRRGVSSLPPLNFPRHARKAGFFYSPPARSTRAFSFLEKQDVL